MLLTVVILYSVSIVILIQKSYGLVFEKCSCEDSQRELDMAKVAYQEELM